MSDQINGLGQGPGPGPSAQPEPDSSESSASPNPLDTMSSSHSALGAKYDQLKSIQGRVALFRSAIDGLISKGDTITPEDVIDAAGKIVSKGIDPMQLAGLLANMPQGGVALQGWLKQQEAQFAQQEQTLAQAHEGARHQVGVSALRMLAAHAVHGSPPKVDRPTNALGG